MAQAMPFRRGPRDSDPTAGNPSQRVQHDESSKWDIKNRLEDFAVSQAEKLREKIRPTVDTANLPVRVIPAPARHGTALAQVLEEEEHGRTRAVPAASRTPDADATDASHTAPVSYLDPDTSMLGRTLTNHSASAAPPVTTGPPIVVEASRREVLNHGPGRPGDDASAGRDSRPPGSP